MSEIVKRWFEGVPFEGVVKSLFAPKVLVRLDPSNDKSLQPINSIKKWKKGEKKGKIGYLTTSEPLLSHFLEAFWERLVVPALTISKRTKMVGSEMRGSKWAQKGPVLAPFWPVLVQKWPKYPNICQGIRGKCPKWPKKVPKSDKTRKKPEKSGKMTYLDKIWSSDLKMSFFRTFWGVAKKVHFFATFWSKSGSIRDPPISYSQAWKLPRKWPTKWLQLPTYFCTLILTHFWNTPLE